MFRLCPREVYYMDFIAAAAFPNDGGSVEAVKEDFEFYGFNSDLGDDVDRLKVEDYWDFQPLTSALDRLGDFQE